MSKKPVPKKKQAASSTRSRHSKYVFLQRRKLEEKLQLVVCDHCGEKKRLHYACPSCGYYRGKKVLEVKTTTTPTTEIKA